MYIPRQDRVSPPEARLPRAAPAGLSTFIDLFCGIGGFHYAAASLGLRCVFASDIDEAARRQYHRNFGMVPEGDITRIDAGQIPDHDMLFAGFPCQPFSIIGNRAGTDDRRGVLVYEIIRILRAKQPAAFVLENVKQFASAGRGRVMAEVLQKLEDAGYATNWTVLNALDYGLPQRRERVIIVGVRGEPARHTTISWLTEKDASRPGKCCACKASPSA